MAHHHHRTLFDLPVELRHKIYGTLLRSNENLCPKKYHHPQRPTQYHSFWAMGLVCRSMHEDAKSIFFGQNTFQFSTTTRITAWFRQIGKSIQYVRRISIWMPQYRYPAWRLVLKRLGRRAPNLQILQLWVRSSMLPSLGSTVDLTPLTKFQT